MANRTRAQLVTRALQKLKVVGSGQTASAEDSQLVDDVVGPVLQSLSRRAIFQWGDEDDLPEEAFEHLADCVAHAAAPDFGKSYGDDAALRGFERRLRELEPYALSGQRQTTEYF